MSEIFPSKIISCKKFSDAFFLSGNHPLTTKNLVGTNLMTKLNLSKSQFSLKFVTNKFFAVGIFLENPAPPI